MIEWLIWFLVIEAFIGLVTCGSMCFDGIEGNDGTEKLSPNYIEACKQIISANVDEFAKPIFRWGSLFTKLIIVIHTPIHLFFTLGFFSIGRTIKYAVIFLYYVIKFAFLAIFKNHKS